MKNAIRTAVLGDTQFKKEIVTIGDQKVMVRAPSVKSRSAILKAAKLLGGDKDKLELGALQVTAVIECCFDPETNEKCFDDADRDVLLEAPAGSSVDALCEVAMRLMNVDEGQIAKNSERTPTDSASSQ